MIYLLDTNIISETIKPFPHKHAMEWLASTPQYHFCLSVITIGEIRKGIERTTDVTKKFKLATWLDVEIARSFNGRIIDIDEAVADKWGYICSKDPNLPITDSLIAATAMARNLKVVTRNSKDFIRVPGLEVINPWEDNI
jgi:predicted nucleic acid-binding protein